MHVEQTHMVSCNLKIYMPKHKAKAESMALINCQ